MRSNTSQTQSRQRWRFTTNRKIYWSRNEIFWYSTFWYLISYAWISSRIKCLMHFWAYSITSPIEWKMGDQKIRCQWLSVTYIIFLQTKLLISLYISGGLKKHLVTCVYSIQCNGWPCHMKSISNYTLCRTYYYAYKLFRSITALTCIYLIDSSPIGYAGRNYVLTQPTCLVAPRS